MQSLNFRYPGVQPFSKEQKAQFFGRDEDIERLLDLIFLEKLTVLFGKSGYGKSSLLNAGILPRLDEETVKNRRRYIPVTVRFNLWTGEQDTLLQKFMFHASHTLEPLQENKMARVIQGVPDTLWSQLKFADIGSVKSEEVASNQHPTNLPVTFVLIFDQFEEFFTYPQAQQQDFKRQLSELLYADVPTYLKQNEDRHTPEELAFLYEKMDVKVILSIRADRLSDLDRMKDKLPAILHKRYELRALSREQAREALVKPAHMPGHFRSPAFNWQPETTERILQELSSDSTGRSSGVEAFQLQILAQNIESRVIRGEIADRNGDGSPDVYPEDLPADLSNIYAEYYRNKIADLPEARQLVARKLIEDGLIFTGEQGEARRLSMDGDVLRQQFGADEALLKSLEDTFLVRREVNSLGGWNYELSHDTLVKPVVAAREIRRTEEGRLENERRRREVEAQIAKERRRRQRANALSLVAVLGSLIAGWQYWDAHSAREKANAVLDRIYFYDGRFGLAYEDGKYGFIDRDLNPKIDFKYMEAMPFDYTGFAWVKRLNDNHKQVEFVIDTLGNEYPLAYDVTEMKETITALDMRNRDLDSLPLDIFKHTQLKVLMLAGNQLKQVPPEIGNMKNLIFLGLSRNRLEQLPAELGNLANLKTLQVFANQITQLPPELGGLKNLARLDLIENPINKTEWDHIRKMLPQCKILFYETGKGNN